MPAGTRTLAALLRGLVDYAGLFPPAAHNMAETVAGFAGYRNGPDAEVLGRLVVPAARLMEWEQAAAALPREVRGPGPWTLSALVSMPPAREFQVVAGFNRREAGGHDLQARVDSVEVKVATPDEVRRVARERPDGVELFYECVSGDGLPALLDEIAAAGGGAKLRTGGLVPSAIAPTTAIAQFLAACTARSVPFKATAGLHHPVRASHPLTYEPDSPHDVMNGFLNVFVSAVLAYACRLDAAQLLPVLEETSPGAFRFSDTHLAWRDLSATVEQVTAARQLARSFGSCSFEEPIADLKALHAYL